MKFLPTIAMVSLSAVLIGGCGSDTSQEADAVGTLSLHLSTTSPLQIEYRLRDAIFQIRGPEDRDVSSENYLDDPADQPINEVMRSGVYTVTLAAGWRMEHRAIGQAYSDIPATLTSANPLNVTVITDEVTPAIFQFEVEEGQISFGPGTVALQVGVDEIGPEWGTAELIESNDDDRATSMPQVAVDAHGNAIALWVQVDVANSLWANHYTPSGGWGTAQLLESLNTYVEARRVAMDPQGNGMVVWSQIDGSTNVYARAFTPGGGGVWGPVARLDMYDDADASGCDVALGPQGNGLAVWEHRTQAAGPKDIYASRYTPSGGWETQELIENGVETAVAPRVAIDGLGNAMVVWAQGDVIASVFARRLKASGSWGPLEVLESDDLGTAWAPRVAMDSLGNAIAVWRQDDGTQLNVWSNRFTLASRWGAAEFISGGTAGTQLSYSATAMGADGDAITVWTEGDDLYARRFAKSGDWGPITLLEGLVPRPYYADVAMDSKGNAIAVWVQKLDDQPTRSWDIWTNRFTSAGGWAGMSLLEKTDPNNTPLAFVAADSVGNAIVVWRGLGQSSVDSVYANHFR